MRDNNKPYLFSYSPALSFSAVKGLLDGLEENQPRVDAFFQASKELVEGGRLDKTDVEGVDKTKNALAQRWNAVNDHLKERQRK